MNSLTLTGRVVSDPQIGKGQNGTPKALFDISSDSMEGPLYFGCVCFGHPATAAASLKPGDKIFAAGKLVTSRFGQAMSFSINSFELIGRNDDK